MTECNNFNYDFDTQEGDNSGGFTRQTIGRFDKTMELLQFNNQIIHTNDADSLFKCFQGLGWFMMVFSTGRTF